MARNPASIHQAVTLLGIDTIKALVLSAQVFAHFRLEHIPSFSLDALWHHSLAIATCTKRIAESENCARKLLDDMFMAGLAFSVHWRNFGRQSVCALWYRHL